MAFLKGSPEQHDRISTLLPGQQGLYNQLENAAQKGPGGAFGQAGNYYQGLLSNESNDFNAFAAPEQRRFREQTIPGLAEQFAGMGSGGLSSSGFRNATVNAGTDLSERLGAIRANLRQQGAQGLQGLGQFGLGNFSQDVMTQPGTEGLSSYIGPAIGAAAGAFGGPVAGALGTAAGNAAVNYFQNRGNKAPTPSATANIYKGAGG